MGRRIAWPRGKMVGGSSNINAMIYTRSSPLDFAAWPSTWSYDQVEPCFEEVEQILFESKKAIAIRAPLP